MKLFVFLFLAFSALIPPSYATELDETFVSETASWELIVVPDDMSFTQRYIITEMKELRTDLESTKRMLNTELNTRELASIDRALAYSSNTVNFLWLILTMAVTGFWLVGWRTMKDVRENLTNNFEKEVQKRVSSEHKKLEAFMKKLQDEQVKQSEDILKNQEFISKKQEAAYFWSQFNREDNLPAKLELLENILAVDISDDLIFIHQERSSIYIELGLWDKAVESADKWLEIQSENSNILYNKAIAQVMLKNNSDAVKTLLNIIQIDPIQRATIDEDEYFKDILPEFHSYIKDIDSSHNI